MTSATGGCAAGQIRVPSYCRICPALCGILVDIDQATGRAVAIHGDPDHAMSRGFTCLKGRALPEEHNATDRLTGSFRRSGSGTFEPVPHAQAIHEIAARLNALIEEHGPRSVALYVGTRGYETLQLAAATAWLRGVKSPSLYSTYTIDQPGKDLARALHGSWPAGFQDVETSDVVLLAGNNPLVSALTPYIAMPMTNVRIELRRLKKRGLRLIVIDPRVTETAQWADVHLRPRPGTDAVLLAGLLREILEKGLADRAFVRENARGLDELEAALEPFTPAFVARCSGVAPEDVERAAEMFGAGPRGCAVGGTGINMAPHPILSEYLLLCLNTVCGRYRRAGEQVTNPGVLTPGRNLVAEPRGPRPIWGLGDEQPRVRGLSTLYDQMPSAALADEILTPGEGQIRALVVSGGNPLVALPDQAKTQRALAALELTVSLDVRWAQTALQSDYVIGCKLSLEKADTTLGSDLRFPRPFAQVTPAVLAPPVDVIEEWEFFWELAQAMGTMWDLGGRVGMPIPIDVGSGNANEHKPTTDGLWAQLCSNARVPYETVRAHPHGLAPDLDAVVICDSTRSAEERERLDCAEPSMLEELRELMFEIDDASYPFRLTSRRMWEFYNSWGQNIETVQRRHSVNPAFMHPDDLTGLGCDDGDIVQISSPHATIDAVVASADDVARGTISMAHGWGAGDQPEDVQSVGSSTSRLVDNEQDVSAFVGMARQSAIPVRVAKRRSP